jgi:hypothetical protein
MTGRRRIGNMQICVWNQAVRVVGLVELRMSNDLPAYFPGIHCGSPSGSGLGGPCWAITW